MHGTQLTLEEYAEAAAKRDAAMDSVAAHADEAIHGWTTQALQFMERYARLHPEFICEKCAAWSYEQGLADPPDPRAWGKIVRRAAKKKFIAKNGYAVSANRNNSPTVLWASLIYGKPSSDSNVVAFRGGRQ